MGDAPNGPRVERVEDTRLFLCSKRSLLGRKTMWRWSIEWSGVGRRKSSQWWPTREQAEEAGFIAWSAWWRERS
jgi:hypothetical protein